MDKLQGKVILITGANSAIAQAFAKLALEENAKAVILSDIGEHLGKLNAEKLGNRCYFIQLNVCRQDDWKNAINWIDSKFGQLDVLINNAGISGIKLDPPMLNLEKSSLESWQTVINHDLDSIYLGCSEAINLMKQGSASSIVILGSRSALVSRPNRMAYGAAKAGAINLTKSIAIYCLEKKYDIRCNIVLPSTIFTEMWNPILFEDGKLNEEKFKAISDRIPLKRFGRPEEVAKTILFLSSDDSSYITGTEIIIDGGAQALDSLRS